MKVEEIGDVLSQLEYKGWRFELGGNTGDLWLRVEFYAPDTSLGARPFDAVAQHGRKWRLSPWMTRSEVVQTALKAVLTAEEHEAREQFLYRGRAIFGPHLDVDTLWDHCAEHLDKRA